MLRALAVALLVLVVGCSEETTERSRFDGEGGAGGAVATGASGGGVGVGGSSAGGGGQGGNATSERVCFGDTLTLSDLQLTEGDGEFDGNGPVVSLTAELTATASSATVQACVRMRETQSDWSTGTRCQQMTVNVANSGLLSATDFSAEYTDTDHEADNVFNESTTLNLADELVVSAQCVGDTSGADICAATDGSCAMCLVTLGCFTVSK